MNDARNDELKSCGPRRLKRSVAREVIAMLIRNLNMDARMRWSAIIAIVSTLTWATHAFAQQRAPAASSYAPSRCGIPVAPNPYDAIDRAVVAWMLRSRTPGASLAILRHGQVIKEQAYGVGRFGELPTRHAEHAIWHRLN